jgi:hypothetical protein
MESIVIGCIFIGIPAVLGSIYRANLAHQRFMKVLQLKAEFNARMLDRVGSDPAMVEFLKAEVQNQMFDVRLSEPAGGLVPPQYSRMLTALQLSFMLFSLGVAFLWLRGYMHSGDAEAFLTFGALGVALGFGAMLSAAAALFVGRLTATAEGRA